MKKYGLLLHITSLPNEFGIGDLGPSAYQFADYLAENGYKYWQILPLNQTGYGNSPYNPLSAFALNPYLISPELLYEDGLIDLPDLMSAKLPVGNQVPYESVYRLKDILLKKAGMNYLSDMEIYDYIESNALHLKPYLAYKTLCNLYGDNDWHLFQPEHKQYSDALYETLFRQYSRFILTCACSQALVKDQLHRLKDYLNSQGLLLIGDMPLYLSYHSAEVWSNQHLFDLNAFGERLNVAGVPPDAFSSDGQLWGNPLYNWGLIAESGFKLFSQRITSALSYLDIMRLDHFIGYVNYWSVKCPFDQYGHPILPADAKQGSWQRAKPDGFFSNLRDSFPPESFIAEDLGILNDEVCRYRDHFDLKGMIVLQFCFEEGVPDPSSYPRNRFIYTGTHDNPTSREWFESLASDSLSRSNLINYVENNRALFAGLALDSEESIATSISKIMCIIAKSSGCENVIIPVQDVLGDGSLRMNVPGTALGNWQWRMKNFDTLFDRRGIFGLDS
jgi:4-alpha-glucanotransferase